MQKRFVCFGIVFFKGLGGRGFSGEGDDVFSPDDHEAETSLDLLLYSGFVGFGDAVLFGVGEDDVHVFVEGEEGAHHHPAVLDGNSHSEIDPLEEFAPLCGHQIYNRLFPFRMSKY